MFGSRDPDHDGDNNELPHERLLARQMRMHGRLRYAVSALICVGAFIGDWVVGIKGLDHAALVVVALVIAAVNTAVVLAARRLADVLHQDRRATRLSLLKLRHATIVADYLALAVLIELVGGARSPFMAVFLLHIVLGSVMVSRSAAWLYTAFAIALTSFLILGELLGVLAPVSPTGAVLDSSPLLPRYAATLLAAYAFLFVVTTFLMTTLADLLRKAEQGLLEAKSKLEILSEARRDFLHVAFHDLKSPLAAVSMMLENLRIGLAGPVTEKQKQLIQRSLARLDESRNFMLALNKLAQLEAADLGAISESVEVVPLLRRIVDEHRDLAAQRNQTLRLEEPDQLPLAALGSALLLREAIANLVTNAIKFTPREGAVTLGCERAEPKIHIWVRDTGPGIPLEQQHKLFLEFARLDTTLPDGEKPKGSGLGLSIVKRIADAHDGTVTVQSTPGRGATFTLIVPAAEPEPAASDQLRPGDRAPESSESPSPAEDDTTLPVREDHDNLSPAP